MLNKNEYRAAVVLSEPFKSPVAMVKPERENPGSAARPCAIAIIIEVFKVISFLSGCFFAHDSLNRSKAPVRTSKVPTIAGLNTRNPATSFRDKQSE